MHDARQAFIKSGSDEKLRRALRHQVRTSSEVNMLLGLSILQETNRQLLEGTRHSNWTRGSASPDQAWFYIPENASV